MHQVRSTSRSSLNRAAGGKRGSLDVRGPRYRPHIIEPRATGARTRSGSAFEFRDVVHEIRFLPFTGAAAQMKTANVSLDLSGSGFGRSKSLDDSWNGNRLPAMAAHDASIALHSCCFCHRHHKNDPRCSVAGPTVCGFQEGGYYTAAPGTSRRILDALWMVLVPVTRAYARVPRQSISMLHGFRKLLIKDGLLHLTGVGCDVCDATYAAPINGQSWLSTTVIGICARKSWSFSLCRTAAANRPSFSFGRTFTAIPPAT
jgi:hypothetical protein